MRFVQFCIDGKQCIGLENGNGGGIVNLSAADASFPTDMRSFIEGGEAVWKKAENYKSATPICRDHVQLLAPITSCDKVLCVGMNYKDHCEEQNAPVPVQPVIFNKFPSCIMGPADKMDYPAETKCLDWEVELTIVIGKEGRNIKEADAMSHVFGYTIANDLSARDWQLEPGRNGGQWLIGKAMHQFCPLGPAIVTPGELGDPHKLGLRCRVNGVVKQDSNTDQLVHKTEQILAFISRFMCLKPGDLILTGTPPGVGCFRKPPEYMKTGDVVEVEVDGIGTVTTTIV
ncbi:fumarylacetoacetate hydrolase domain-containing protein 2-like [Mya arenaria]|uniref:fumarylacetoacetate hydrolase domain-containing protein 2-like n=1 Tax=Mya arenaria TaxID=6604 RepID=UPI0022E01C03|nr:fumarylacetoacetate hydrolase domain-containing protein 2-like [Mya arenaria]